MNGVAIVICVNITMSCLYQIVPYMCSMYPLSVDNIKKQISSTQIRSSLEVSNYTYWLNDIYSMFLYIIDLQT